MIFYNNIVSLLSSKIKIKIKDEAKRHLCMQYNISFSLFFKNFSFFLVQPPETPQTFFFFYFEPYKYYKHSL